MNRTTSKIETSESNIFKLERKGRAVAEKQLTQNDYSQVEIGADLPTHSNLWFIERYKKAVTLGRSGVRRSKALGKAC